MIVKRNKSLWLISIGAANKRRATLTEPWLGLDWLGSHFWAVEVQQVVGELVLDPLNCIVSAANLIRIRFCIVIWDRPQSRPGFSPSNLSCIWAASQFSEKRWLIPMAFQGMMMPIICKIILSPIASGLIHADSRAYGQISFELVANPLS